MTRLQRPSSDSEVQLALVDMPSVAVRTAKPRRRDLDLRELGQWARRQVHQIAANRGDSRGSLNLLLAQTVKLGEEVGELYAEVLGAARLQRIAKSGQFSDETVRDELADVLICVAILADLLDVDLGDAARKKMEKIDDRQRHNTRHA